MDKRTILAVLLCILVWIVWQALFVEPQKPLQRPDGGSDGALVASETPKVDPEPAPQQKEPAERRAEEQVTLKNEVVEIVLSSRGASARQVRLLDFFERRSDGKLDKEERANLVTGDGELAWPFRIRFFDEKTTFKWPRFTDWEIESKEEGRVTFVYRSPEESRIPLVRKTFSLPAQGYLLELEVEIANHLQESIEEQLIFEIPSAYQAVEVSGCMGCAGAPMVPRAPTCLANGEVISVEPKPGSVTSREPAIGWAGINEQYFLLAAIPRGVEKAACQLEARQDKLMAATLMVPSVTLAPGGTARHAIHIFCGPKQLDLLKSVSGGTGGDTLSAGLERSVDFGWLAFLCLPMLWLLKAFYSVVGNYGVAIIFLTLVVRLLMQPLTNKQMKSMKAMASLKPFMDEIKKKYGNDRARYNEEIMKLYKVHGVSPLTGCLPMLLQMPIWIALYRTLYSSVELYQSAFIPGWIDDLSYRDPLFILPIAMGVGMFLQQKFTPTTADPAQAKMMLYMMPALFTFLMLYLPAGLVLYIFVSSLLSIANQIWFNRRTAKIAAAPGNPA
ncbi:MAG: membrane protein insertase YidC [Myxococcales bacterium]|nr:membrane protein insertase YidC [Myxococcales bacterium]